MGYKEIIQQEIDRAVKANGTFKNPEHFVSMCDLWEKLEGVAKLEVLSSVRTYKITYGDGRVAKAHKHNGEGTDYNDIVADKGIPIPRTLGKVEGWKMVEWFEGLCMRDSINSGAALKKISPDLWYKKGVWLGKVASIQINEYDYITMNDVLWTNFIVTPEDEVIMIDTKKLTQKVVPEMWIIYFISFSQHLLRKQVEAFTDGYVEGLRGPRSRKDLILNAKELTERVYEKLASF